MSELARNGWCDPKSQPARVGRPALAGGYRAVTAHQRAALSRSRGRTPARLAEDGFLWSQVQKLLRQRYYPNMVSIHQRPPEVDERVIPGHWEGDLIKGSRNASAVGALVKRTSLFVTSAKVADGGAQAAFEGFSMVLNRIDAQLRLSMTYDQGREMSHHEQLSERTCVKVYFAEPHSPWQHGINENTSGLLRQYLPKEIDLSVFSQEEPDTVAWALNTRPRKSLGFKCPAELFLPDTFNADEYYRRLVAIHSWNRPMITRIITLKCIFN